MRWTLESLIVQTCDGWKSQNFMLRCYFPWDRHRSLKVAISGNVNFEHHIKPLQTIRRFWWASGNRVELVCAGVWVTEHPRGSTSFTLPRSWSKNWGQLIFSCSVELVTLFPLLWRLSLLSNRARSSKRRARLQLSGRALGVLLSRGRVRGRVSCCAWVPQSRFHRPPRVLSRTRTSARTVSWPPG